MFLSKLFGIFKRKKQTEEQPSNPQGEVKTAMPTAGTVVGGAAASSGLSDQSTTSSDQVAADISEPEPVAGNTISQQEDTFQPESTQTVAQTDSTPSYSTEEPSLNIPEESTETVNAPEAESYQSGSTEEPKLPPDSSTPQLPDDGSASSEVGSDAAGSDDQSAGDSAGPSIG